MRRRLRHFVHWLILAEPDPTPYIEAVTVLAELAYLTIARRIDRRKE